MKKWFGLLIKILISFLGLYFVIDTIDLSQAIAVLNIGSLIWFVPALFLYLFSKYLTAIRYSYLLQCYDCYLTHWYNMKLYLCGMYYNLILPGGIGGDFYKAYIINKNKAITKKELLIVTFKDRAYGALAIVLILCSLMGFSAEFRNFKLIIILFAGLTYLIYFVLVKLLFPKLIKTFYTSFLLSLLGQFIQVIAFGMLLKLMGINSQFIMYLGVFLISSLIASLPITIGGLGIREVTFLYITSYYQLNVNLAVAASMLFYLITVLASLTGLPFSWMMNETVHETSSTV